MDENLYQFYSFNHSLGELDIYCFGRMCKCFLFVWSSLYFNQNRYFPLHENINTFP